MGPSEGPCEVLPSGATTSALFAALINGAASHVVEQDDVHNGSVFHPATVIFPAVVAVGAGGGQVGTRRARRDGRRATKSAFASASFSAGRTTRSFTRPERRERSRAAAAVAKLLGLDADATQHAMGSAGTQAAGLWEFLRDGADSKQLHTAKAAADGLLAAYLARDGVTGAKRILEGAQGMAAGMSTDADPARLTDGLGHAVGDIRDFVQVACVVPAHASVGGRAARAHGARAVDARPDRRRDRARSPGAIDVLGQVTNPQNIHQAKFSMGTVLGLIAVHGDARLDEFEQHAFGDPRVAAFRERVEMVLDAEVDTCIRASGSERSTSRRKTAARFKARVDVPKGDPGQRALTRASSKTRRRSSDSSAERRPTPRFAPRRSVFGNSKAWMRLGPLDATRRRFA